MNIFGKIARTGLITLPAEDLQVGPLWPRLIPDRCNWCGKCAAACPTAALALGSAENGTEHTLVTKVNGRAWRLEVNRCIACQRCQEACPTGAVQAAGVVEEVSGRVGESKAASLHIRHLDSGSCNACDWEMTALLNSVYDIQRWGFDFVASPRHADALMVTGAVTANLREAVEKTYTATPEPKVVIAVGACAASGGLFTPNYAVAGGVEEVIPVDVRIAGCPPTPAAMVAGLFQAAQIFSCRRKQKAGQG